MDGEPLSHARKVQKLARKTSRGEHAHAPQYGQVPPPPMMQPPPPPAQPGLANLDPALVRQVMSLT